MADMRTAYCIWDKRAGVMVEGGFFSRDAANDSCDTWNAEDRNDDIVTNERIYAYQRRYEVRTQARA